MTSDAEVSSSASDDVERTDSEATDSERTEPETTKSETTKSETTKAEVAEEEAVQAEGEPKAGRGRSKGLLILAAVLLVVAVVATTTSAVFYGRWRDDRDRRRDVRTAASAVVTDLTTYDYTNLDDFRVRVLAGSTGKFAQEFDQAYTPLKDTLSQTQARSVGTVRKVFTTDGDGGAAEAIVIADQVVTTAGGRRPVEGQQLTVSLVRVDGRWKVDGLTYDVGSAETPGTTSTTSR